jgi:adenylate cyclase
MKDDRKDFLLWLLVDARRIRDSSEFLNALAERLRTLGSSVTRVSTGVPILHPQAYSFSGLWELGKGVRERTMRGDADSLQRLENSPVKIAYEGGGPVRCDPTKPPERGEFGILADLRRDGATDYIVYSLPFSDGTNKSISLATNAKGGFTDEEIDLFEAMTPALCINLELQALRRTARTLLDTYIGPQTSKRVFDGVIKRGMGETIRAVICLFDLRGFTALSEAMSRDALIEILNLYFGAICEIVEANGGEVLKFVGDGLLAIFPTGDRDAGPACRQAITAAKSIGTRMTEINNDRGTEEAPKIDYGLALHIGEVMYGNIGGENRLDFTVIGPAVNLAARIEALCGEVDQKPLLSQPFVAASGVDARSLGRFTFKGIKTEQEVFALNG